MCVCQDICSFIYHTLAFYGLISFRCTINKVEGKMSHVRLILKPDSSECRLVPNSCVHKPKWEVPTVQIPPRYLLNSYNIFTESFQNSFIDHSRAFLEWDCSNRPYARKELDILQTRLITVRWWAIKQKCVRQRQDLYRVTKHGL